MPIQDFDEIFMHLDENKCCDVCFHQEVHQFLVKSSIYRVLDSCKQWFLARQCVCL